MISMTLKHSTRLTCATLAALITAVAADGTSCSSAEHNSTDSAAIFFQHAGASLMVATDDPPPSEHLVHVRERRNLVYSHRSEMPEFISSPTSAAFPLLVHADENATMMMTTAAEAAGEEAAQRTATLEDYAHAARALLDERLVAHGAVVLRGLPIANGEEYGAFVSALTAGWGFEAKKLGGGGTQRTELSANVRSASDEPTTQTIEPHMDMAHSVAHPKRMSLFCAARGPAAGRRRRDSAHQHARRLPTARPGGRGRDGGLRRARWRRVPQAAVVGEPRQPLVHVAAVFFTSELEQALTEVRQRDEGARVHEHGPEVIDFREVLPAVHTHPVSGEKVWFNGVHTNHRSYYFEAAHVDTSDGSPMDTSYADGTPITDETIAQVRAAYWRNSVAVRMQTGDVTFLDNMLVSHGRMSWVPPAPRRMLLTHFVKRVDGDEQGA